MGLVLDTSLFIAAERQRFRLSEFLDAEAAAQSVFLSAITASELLQGVERATGARRKRRSRHIEEILATVDLIEFDLPCAREHARLWAELESKGQRIGAHDMLIAASCLAMKHDLATLNEGEFERIKGLQLVDARNYCADGSGPS